VYGGNSLQTFQNNLSGPIFQFLTFDDRTNKLSQNVGEELPLYTAFDPRKAQISSSLWQKPEITVERFFIVKARSKNCITISQIIAQNTFNVEHSLHVQWQCEDFQFLIHGYFGC